MKSVPADVPVGNPLALTFQLPLRNQSAAESAAAAVQTPGNASYHHFLSVSQFVNRYGPSDAQLSKLRMALAALGFKVSYVFQNHLAVEAISSTGTAESVLGLTLQNVNVNGRSAIRSTTPLRIPPALAGLVLGVSGFDTVTRPGSNVASTILPKPSARMRSSIIVGGTPGNYLPADFEHFYGVEPIAKRGITGRGSTIGIVTLATFHPSDAYSFWKQIGLNVSPSRITKVDVDNGDNPLNYGGADETDLDVEQSGAIAPDANIRVYIAPVQTNNYINAFESAASENIADTISSSWGEPELQLFDQFTRNTGAPAQLYALTAFHDVFLEFALQGQSVFIASGDSGAFDTVLRGFPVFGTPTPTTPIFSAPYAIEAPANDPLVTAAGGTTLPFDVNFTDPAFHLSVAHQQAWGWRYVADQLAAQGLGKTYPVSDFFPEGSGGGVSCYWPTPWYQALTKGITVTKPGQALTVNIGAGPRLLQALPADFKGRNIPDISADADPYSGYQLLYEGV